MDKPKKRCPNGFRRNKMTGECEPKAEKVNKPKVQSKPKAHNIEKPKKCPNGFRRNKKTGECEPKAGKVNKPKVQNNKPKTKTVSNKKMNEVKFFQIIEPLVERLDDKNKLQLLSTMKHHIPMDVLRERMRKRYLKKPVKDVLNDAYKKIDRLEKGGKPRFSYKELLYVYLVHNPGPQKFKDIVGEKKFGVNSMTDTIKDGLEKNTIRKITVPGVKAQYKGHKYELTFDYSECVRPELLNITAEQLYKKCVEYLYRAYD